jgi:hypothetical protein
MQHPCIPINELRNMPIYPNSMSIFYFESIMNMLFETKMNVYVNKMILDYYLCDENSGFKKLKN